MWVGGKFLKALVQLFRDSTCIGIPMLCLADKLRIVMGVVEWGDGHQSMNSMELGYFIRGC